MSGTHRTERNGEALRAGGGGAEKLAAPAPERPTVAEMVESIVGCKWSLRVLAQIRAGVRRPGAILRANRGLSTKVLNERLAKMLRHGIVQRVAFPEVPPRVEYSLTPFGERFARVIDAIEELEHDAAAAAEARNAGGPAPKDPA